MSTSGPSVDEDKIRSEEIARCRAGLGVRDLLSGLGLGSTNVADVSRFIGEACHSKHIGSAYKTDEGWIVEVKRPDTPNPAQEPANKVEFKRRQAKK
jgi:hypothetical protein